MQQQQPINFEQYTLEQLEKMSDQAEIAACNAVVDYFATTLLDSEWLRRMRFDTWNHTINYSCMIRAVYLKRKIELQERNKHEKQASDALPEISRKK